MLLQGHHITKSYGSLQVLKDVSIDVKKGEIVSIVGDSGAGKSTLLQTLGSLDAPDDGDVFLADVHVNKLYGNKLADFRNKHIGFIFQFHNLLPEFTALENVCLPGYIARRKDKDVVKRAKELLDLLGLSHRMDHKPAEMSGGEQQRTAVARALINGPEVILADEPSGNLDSRNAKDLHNLFFNLRDEFDQTFVIVTHNEELAGMADRRLVMKDGVFVDV